MRKHIMAPTPLLAMDNALALLDGYEPTSVEDLPPLADVPTSRTKTDRFRRARERKKQELAFYRTQVTGLEQALRVLKQKRLRGAVKGDGSPLVDAWQLAAIRQEQERREAEMLNAQLKCLVEVSLKQCRRLQVLLRYPDGLEPLIHHKRLKQNDTWNEIAEAFEIHNLTLAVDLLEFLVDDTVAQFQEGSDLIVKVQDRGNAGCGIQIEAMDTRVLPYDMQTASQSMWQFLAFENGPLRIESTRDTATRVFSMEMANGSFRGAYKGTFLYRRRATADGNVVITWCSDWTPMEPFDHDDIAYFTHESFRREGFVRFIPSTSDPSRVTRLHMLYRFERPACGLDSCRRGVCGDVTVETADEAIRECVLWEVNQLFQGMENDIISRRRLLQLAIDSKSATSRTVTP